MRNEWETLSQTRLWSKAWCFIIYPWQYPWSSLKMLKYEGRIERYKMQVHELILLILYLNYLLLRFVDEEWKALHIHGLVWWTNNGFQHQGIAPPLTLMLWGSRNKLLAEPNDNFYKNRYEALGLKSSCRAGAGHWRNLQNLNIISSKVKQDCILANSGGVMNAFPISDWIDYLLPGQTEL